MPTYLEFLEDTLDYMLGQKPESADAAGADNERIMKKADGKVLVNQAIEEFVLMNEKRFEEEYSYIFDSYTTVFNIPYNIAKVKAIIVDDKWEIVGDSSDLRSTIRKVASDKLYNSGGWAKGEELYMKVIAFPPTITSDYDVVDFPRGYMRMLALKVKLMAYNIAGKAMAETEIMELERLQQKWVKDTGVVRNKSYISFSGKQYGRRTRG